VNSDNFITPIDALMVINGLNAQEDFRAAGEGEGEGEAAAPEAQSNLVARSSSSSQSLFLLDSNDSEPTLASFRRSPAPEPTVAPLRTDAQPPASRRLSLAELIAALVPAPTSHDSLDEYFAELGAGRGDFLLPVS
jgi:hypothetical protein